MKFALLIAVSMLLQFAVTNPDNHTYDEDPLLWQRSGKFQGDIVLTAEQAQIMFSGNIARNGVKDISKRWPNKVIPYVISDDFTEDQKALIDKILKEDYGKTCVRVVPRTNEADYVFVTGKDSGCWSNIGRIGGAQNLNLQPNGCLYHSSIVHEFMHAIGFLHQHSAAERDDFVTIHWENIKKGWEVAFDKYPSNLISSFGERYDYESVMHYTATAFSKNDKKTIVPKFQTNIEIGTAKKLSSIDIAKINKMYNC